MPVIVIKILKDSEGGEWTVDDGRVFLNGDEVPDVHELLSFLQEELANVLPQKGSKTDADGWIEWEGGECPVDGERWVDLINRDGDVLHDVTANRWCWQHVDLSADPSADIYHSDIVRYRPSKKGGKA